MTTGIETEQQTMFWIERIGDYPTPNISKNDLLIVTEEMRYGSCRLRPYEDFLANRRLMELTDLDLILKDVELCMKGYPYECPNNDPRVSRDIRSLKVIEVDGKRLLVEPRS